MLLCKCSIFSTYGSIIFPGLRAYIGVTCTCSYSSRPFLCALDMHELRPYMEVLRAQCFESGNVIKIHRTEQPSISTRDCHTNSCHLVLTWQFCVIGTNVPEEDAKGVDVDRVVIRTSEEFRCHVDRCADNGARHHGLRLAETEVCQRTTIVTIKL